MYRDQSKDKDDTDEERERSREKRKGLGVAINGPLSFIFIKLLLTFYGKTPLLLL